MIRTPRVGPPPGPGRLPKDARLGVLNEVPMSSRARAVFQTTMYIFMIAILVACFIGGLFSPFIISDFARQAVSSGWFDTLLVIALILLGGAFLGLNFILLQFRYRFVIGGPIFGDIGGVPRRLLRATIRSAPDVRLAFSPADRYRMDRLAWLNDALTISGMRRKFFEIRSSQGHYPYQIQRDWEASFAQISAYSFEGTTLGELRRRYPYALATIPVWLSESSHGYGAIFMSIPAFLALWFGQEWVAGTGSLLPVVEAVVLSSILSATWVFMNQPYRAGRVKFIIPDEDALSAARRDQPALAAAADELRDQEISPSEVRLGYRYRQELMRFSGRAVIWDCVISVLFNGALIGVAFVAGQIFQDANSALSLSDAYGRLFLVIAFALTGFAAGHYLVSLIILDSRKALAPVLTGFIAVALPLFVQYLITGSIGDSPEAVASAIVLGIFGIVATVLAEIAKVRFEGPKATSA